MRMRTLTLLNLLLVASTAWAPSRMSRVALPQGSSQPTQDRVDRIALHSSSEEQSLTADFALEPTSELAEQIVIQHLGLSREQYEKYIELSYLVVEWNSLINLVSRKDCNPSTVFGRHILPSIAACALSDNPLTTAQRVVDVGTGGGFPGLPLAIAYPDTNFVLLDSVGKKLKAVQDMAMSLELDHVSVHHGRAEELFGQQFDVATGRSVSALGNFCAWMHHLLAKDTGKLLYWIGGDVDASILDRRTSDVPIVDLLPEMVSDKRILTFEQVDVTTIARESGVDVSAARKATKNRHNRSAKPTRRKQLAKGAWKSRRNEEQKNRGYEDFQRYSSQ